MKTSVISDQLSVNKLPDLYVVMAIVEAAAQGMALKMRGRRQSSVSSEQKAVKA